MRATAVLAFSVGAAQDPGREALAFREGDRVCFVGDSITGGAFASHIMLFHVLRNPAARIAFENCGVSGDESSGALRRFDWDIAPYRPTVSVVMFGMNDVHMRNYGPDKTGPEDVRRHQDSLTAFGRNMEQLVGRLKALGSRVILVTPSLYDQTGSATTENRPGVNDALHECVGILSRRAGQDGTGLIDLHTPMTQLNTRRQVADRGFSLVGQDRIHPTEVGHFVMAYHILKAQGFSPCVAAVTIDARQGRASTADHCTVSDLSVSNATVSFRYLAQALPFPTEAVLPLPSSGVVPFAEDLNRETVCVTGLASGRYAITIDGATVQTVTASELAEGVNLAANARTPQYRQSLEVKTLGDQRQALVRQLRTMVAVWHFVLLEDADLRPGDHVKAEPLIQAKLVRAREAKNIHGTWMIETYLKTQPRRGEIEKELGQVTEAMWRAAMPQPRRVVIQQEEP